MWIECIVASASLLLAWMPTESEDLDMQIRTIDVGDVDAFPGVVYPRHRAMIRPPMDTLLTEVPVVEGQRVRKGTILAILDDRVAQASLRAATHEAER
ncbi:MAG: biotin/lipoyl-binding protein, partial [Phycisphaerales bacterium]|nr:biotin/lipoyl-binding protein [Phycisphaerales bacterium]